MREKIRTKDSPVVEPEKSNEQSRDNNSKSLAACMALLQEGRAQEAADALRKAFERDPSAIDIRYYLACALLEAGNYKEAAGHFWFFAQDDPQLEDPLSVVGVSFLTGMAKCQAGLGHWSEAYSTMKPAMGVALTILRSLAFILEEANDHARAAHLYSICVMLDPKDVELVVSSGYNKRINGQLADALVDLKWAVRLEPKDADLWYELGLTYAMMKNTREARPILKKALRLDPAHSMAHYDLACLDALEQNAEGAFRHLNKSVDCGFQNLDHLLNDKDFESFHNDPRWRQVVRKIKRRAAAQPGKAGHDDAQPSHRNERRSGPWIN
jgi:tetratricopeptide (TPR) repeat protein